MPSYFITGANRGLGLEFIRQLALSPNNLIIAGVRSLESSKKVLEPLNQHGKIHIIPCDTSSLPSIASIASLLTSILAGAPLDFLVNNAGISSVLDMKVTAIDPAAFHDHMAVNVLGVAKVTETLLSLLNPDGSSVVVNMSSNLASMSYATTRDYTDASVYSLSKAALNMLSVHQSIELAGRAVVVAMHPGWVRTDMGGSNATLSVEESISGMLEVFGKLGREDTGKYLQWDGKVFDW